jgi:hypothetical protein
LALVSFSGIYFFPNVPVGLPLILEKFLFIAHSNKVDHPVEEKDDLVIKLKGLAELISGFKELLLLYEDPEMPFNEHECQDHLMERKALTVPFSPKLGIYFTDLAGGVIIRAQPGAKLVVDIEDTFIHDLIGELTVSFGLLQTKQVFAQAPCQLIRIVFYEIKQLKIEHRSSFRSDYLPMKLSKRAWMK